MCHIVWNKANGGLYLHYNYVVEIMMYSAPNCNLVSEASQQQFSMHNHLNDTVISYVFGYHVIEQGAVEVLQVCSSGYSGIQLPTHALLTHMLYAEGNTTNYYQRQHLDDT